MTATAWTERCKTLANPIIEACTVVPPVAGPGALTKEVSKHLPEFSFRQVLCRGGWYRLGGVVDATGAKLADNLEQWAESALEERDGDLGAVLDDFAGSGLAATRLYGRTHYLVASAGTGSADFLQLEIEALQESVAQALFDREPAPGSLDEFIDPRGQGDGGQSARPVAPPYYTFRRIIHIGDMLARMRTQALEPQPIHRFVADWEQSSAGLATDLPNHWVIAVREHLDRFQQTIIRATPVPAIDGEAPRMTAREGTSGLALNAALSTFDRHAGYPFAWYFHMITTKTVPHWVARTVAEDAAAGFAYLPEKDLKVVKNWLHKPYGF